MLGLLVGVLPVETELVRLLREIVGAPKIGQATLSARSCRYQQGRQGRGRQRIASSPTP